MNDRPADPIILRADSTTPIPASRGVAFEERLLVRLEGRGVRAPHALGLIAPLGFPILVLEHRPGIGAPLEVIASLDDAQGERIVFILGETLAQLHRIDHAALLPKAGSAGTRDLIERIDGWAQAGPMDHPALVLAFDWLRRHAPPPVAPALLHRDFRTGNFLIANGDLSAVLDWDFAGLGDPIEDIGWFTARCWRFGRDGHAAGGLGSMASFLDGYCAGGGGAVPRNTVLYYRVLATARWLAIALQQGGRAIFQGERTLDVALTARRAPELTLDLLDAITEAEG